MSEQEFAPTGDGGNETPRHGDEREGAAGLAMREHDIHHFAALGAALPLGVLSAVGMGTVVYANETATEMLGRPESELLGHGWESGIHPDDRPELVAAIALVLDTAARQRILLRPAGDSGRWLEVTLASLGHRDRPTGWIATIDDVSDRVRLEERLAHQATHDELTLLPNRALLADRLRQAGERLERASEDSVIAVLFVDLDDFKGINDQLGHRVGDEVLVEAARRLTRVVRATDTVARFGGDEFVAVCELPTADEVSALVDRVQRSLERPVRALRGVLGLRASIGVAVAHRGSSDVARLVDLADKAMYDRKAARKRPDRV
jgi:diguanylate cyclase (GGDEF)-like protein/PAS domain S-box-containing protein